MEESPRQQALAAVYATALRSFLASGSRLRWPVVESPLLTVILVLFNRAELTLRCLRSLAEDSSIPLEIIAVDNASTDETVALLDRLDGVKVIRNRENRGFLLAVNQAARRAQGRYLLFLNNDAELLPGALASVLRVMESAPDIGAVGGKLILTDGRLQEAGSIVWSDGSCLGYGRGDSPFAPMYMFRRDVDYCSAAFLLTGRELFLESGLFDEDFQPAYYEDADYCLRLWESGKRVVYDPGAAVVHVEFASSRSASEAVEMQLERREIFVRKHAERLRRHHPPHPKNLIPARTAGGSGLRILFVDDRVPHAFLGAGFPRSREMLLALVEAGHSVTFFPLSFPEEDWETVYQDIPPTVEVMVGWGVDRLEEFLREREGYYQRILVSRPHNMRRLQRVLKGGARPPAGTGLIYDAEAIFALREAGERRLRGEAVAESDLQERVREEAGLARQADAVIAVSEAERKRFLECGLPRVFTLGHSVLPAPTLRPFSDRAGILFVGAVYEDSDPNADAVSWFALEVLPLLRQALGPEVLFRVAGVSLSRRLAALRAPGLELLGWTSDLKDLYDRARLFVAPTRFGAGIPLKIYHAAAHGLPVVCTSLTASHLGWRDGAELLVADGAPRFAEKCAALYRDEALWRRLREGALTRIERECSARAFSASLEGIVRQTARHG